jgi:tRNA-binding protein
LGFVLCALSLYRRNLLVYSEKQSTKHQAQSTRSKLTTDKTSMNVTPIKPLIDFADLEKIDIRVGTIMAVEDIEGADKLLKLTVSFGDHQRTILTGMKQERENPKEIEGRQALFVVNLPPKKMRGQISEGMLFDIGFADGLTPVLAVPEKQISDGARAG